MRSFVPPFMAPRRPEDEEEEAMAALEALVQAQPSEEAQAPAPVEERRDYSAEADRMEDEKGQFLGNDIPEDPTELRRRAMAEYQAANPVEAPGASTRWEDDFVSGRSRVDNRQLNQSWALGLFGGGADFAMRQREQLLNERDKYDAGLAKAKERDFEETQGAQLAGDAMEQAIAASTGIDPKSLRGLRMNHPLVKAFQSGMYSQGLRERGQNLSVHKNSENNETKVLTTEMRNESQERVADKRNQTQLHADKRAAAKKGGGKGGAASAPSPDLLAAHISEVGQIPFEDAQKVVATGDLSAIPADRKQNVQVALVEYQHLLKADPGKAMQVMVDREKKSGTRDDVLAQHVAKVQSDPKYRQKVQTELKLVAHSTKNAVTSWNSMSDQDKAVFTQLAPMGGDVISAIRTSAMSPEGKAQAGAVLGVMNELLKERSGAAVTDSEWGRLSVEMGLAGGSWDPFNSTKGVDSFLNRLRERLQIKRGEYNSTMGGGL